MLVHVFGATSSPSCASFCLIQAAEDNADEFDEVTLETVKRNFYMDDCIKSVVSCNNQVSFSTNGPPGQRRVPFDEMAQQLHQRSRQGSPCGQSLDIPKSEFRK